MNEQERTIWHKVRTELIHAKDSIDKDLGLYERTNVSRATAKIMASDNCEALKQALHDYIDFYDENIKVKEQD